MTAGFSMRADQVDRTAKDTECNAEHRYSLRIEVKQRP